MHRIVSRTCGLFVFVATSHAFACATPNVGYYEADGSGEAWVLVAEWCDEFAMTAPPLDDEFDVVAGYPGGGEGGGGGGYVNAVPVPETHDAIQSASDQGALGPVEGLLNDLPVLPRVVSVGRPISPPRVGIGRISLRRTPGGTLRAREALRPPEQHEIDESDTQFDCSDEYDLRRAAVQRLGPTMQSGDTVTFRFAIGRARPGRAYEFDVYTYSHFAGGGLSLYLTASSCFSGAG